MLRRLSKYLDRQHLIYKTKTCIEGAKETLIQSPPRPRTLALVVALPLFALGISNQVFGQSMLMPIPLSPILPNFKLSSVENARTLESSGFDIPRSF